MTGSVRPFVTLAHSARRKSGPSNTDRLPPSTGAADPSPHDDGTAPLVMPTSITTHADRARHRLAALADDVCANGTGSEIVDTERLLQLVRLGVITVRVAHRDLCRVRCSQQQRHRAAA